MALLTTQHSLLQSLGQPSTEKILSLAVQGQTVGTWSVILV